MKIVAILFVSFWLASFAGTSVFVSNTPQVRQNPGAYIVNRLKNKYDGMVAKLNLPLGKYSKSKEASFARMNDSEALNTVEQTKAELINEPLKTVAKGIYAKDNGQKSMKIINTGEIEQVQLTYVLNGETITIIIPKAYYDSLGLSDEEIIDMSKKSSQAP